MAGLDKARYEFLEVVGIDPAIRSLTPDSCHNTILHIWQNNVEVIHIVSILFVNIERWACAVFVDVKAH